MEGKGDTSRSAILRSCRDWQKGGPVTAESYERWCRYLETLPDVAMGARAIEARINRLHVHNYYPGEEKRPLHMRFVGVFLPEEDCPNQDKAQLWHAVQEYLDKEMVKFRAGMPPESLDAKDVEANARLRAAYIEQHKVDWQARHGLDTLGRENTTRDALWKEKHQARERRRIEYMKDVEETSQHEAERKEIDTLTALRASLVNAMAGLEEAKRRVKVQSSNPQYTYTYPTFSRDLDRRLLGDDEYNRLLEEGKVEFELTTKQEADARAAKKWEEERRDRVDQDEVAPAPRMEKPTRKPKQQRGKMKLPVPPPMVDVKEVTEVTELPTPQPAVDTRNDDALKALCAKNREIEGKYIRAYGELKRLVDALDIHPSPLLDDVLRVSDMAHHTAVYEPLIVKHRKQLEERDRRWQEENNKSHCDSDDDEPPQKENAKRPAATATTNKPQEKKNAKRPAAAGNDRPQKKKHTAGKEKQ